MSTLPKLTALSTQTLTLLLDRQRLQSLNQAPPPSLAQNIRRNLEQLRLGINALSREERLGEAGKVLANQFSQMRGMGSGEEGGIPSLGPIPDEPVEEVDEDNDDDLEAAKHTKNEPFVPYRDEPVPSPDEVFVPADHIQEQNLLMQEQDTRLDALSHSINRQHGISLQINDELDVHTGLLEVLDTELDQTGNRLGGARRRMDTFAKGVKGYGSTLTIGSLILVLLILIIVFKT